MASSVSTVSLIPTRRATAPSSTSLSGPCGTPRPGYSASVVGRPWDPQLCLSAFSSPSLDSTRCDRCSTTVGLSFARASDSTAYVSYPCRDTSMDSSSSPSPNPSPSSSSPPPSGSGVCVCVCVAGRTQLSLNFGSRLWGFTLVIYRILFYSTFCSYPTAWEFFISPTSGCVQFTCICTLL